MAFSLWLVSVFQIPVTKGSYMLGSPYGLAVGP